MRPRPRTSATHQKEIKAVKETESCLDRPTTTIELLILLTNEQSVDSIMNEEMDQCDFGTILGENCHKTSYVGKAGLRNLSEFSRRERSILLWRGGMRELDDE